MRDTLDKEAYAHFSLITSVFRLFQRTAWLKLQYFNQDKSGTSFGALLTINNGNRLICWVRT